MYRFAEMKVIQLEIKTEDRIRFMRGGGKLKCPRCKEGYISAAGDPKTTKVFKCSHCLTAMTLTVALKEETLYMPPHERLNRLKNGEKVLCKNCKTVIMEPIGDLEKTNTFICRNCNNQLIAH